MFSPRGKCLPREWRVNSAQHHKTRFSKRRFAGLTEDCDSLVVSGPLTEEEAQVASVSGFLSFVPFQILKRTRQDSREIILRGQRAGEGNRIPVTISPRL